MKLSGISNQGLKRLARLAQSEEPEVEESEESEESGSGKAEMLDLIQFLHENPNSADTELHEWAEGKGLAVDKVEAQAYTLASALVEFLHNGKAYESDFTEDDASSEELAMGVEVESEHTSNPTMAKRIALDHLCEIKDYYTRLKRMESEAKKGKE